MNYEKIREFFFPERLTCTVCRRENFNGETICDECYKILPRNDKEICDHCGRRVAYAVGYCDYCKNRSVLLDGARSVYEYKEPINGLIRRLKYYGEKYLAREFAEDLAKLYLRRLPTVDIVTFVPTTPKRLKVRGYNQSKLIAEEFCKISKIPLVETLVKTRETESQVGLSLKERENNLKGSFKSLGKNLVDGKIVLIVDDVMTTGTTLEIIAEKLKKSGAKEVYALTVASVTFNENFENFPVYEDV